MKIDDYTANVTIQAPANKVWRILGHEFGEIERWSSGINVSKSAVDGEPVAGCDISGRYCDDIQETLTHYSDEEMRFGYVMVDPPFFLKSIGNHWSVHEIGSNETRVEFRPEIETKFGWGLIIYPLFRLGGPWMANRVFEELKHYVEHDEPHPRKAKAIHKDKGS